MSNFIDQTKLVQEKVLLVIVDFKHDRTSWRNNQIIEEMTELVKACMGKVIDAVICRIDKPTATYLITEGKVQEIADLCAQKKFDTVIFSKDLKGSQQRNIEDRIRVNTIDRTQLILDIFARRATSSEGKMQVELAQLEYLLPRLVGKGIELSRLGGGIGTLGPGETKLEIDRRRIAQRISRLKKDLKDVAKNHTLKRKMRKDKGIPTLSLVGYTNAGKSTLLNMLTQAGQVTHDGLFTTLDSLTRQLILPSHQRVVVSDTVGFMHDLPHHLIESFKTTLQEVREADILLHVVDVSQPNFQQLHDDVIGILGEIGGNNKPTITVFNKMDKMQDEHSLVLIKEKYAKAVCISALTGKNIDELLRLIGQLLASLYVEVNIDLPINRMDLVNMAHEEGEVFSVKYYNDKINLRASIPAHLAGKFAASGKATQREID